MRRRAALGWPLAFLLSWLPWVRTLLYRPVPLRISLSAFLFAASADGYHHSAAQDGAAGTGYPAILELSDGPGVPNEDQSGQQDR